MVMPNGKPGCVMLIADMLPDIAGDEVVVGFYTSFGGAPGYVNYEAIYRAEGRLNRRVLQTIVPANVSPDDAAMLAALQLAPPVVKPSPLNVIDAPGFLLMPYP